jgi:hypothetical protein
LEKSGGWGRHIDGASVLCADGKFYLFFEAVADRSFSMANWLADILPLFFAPLGRILQKKN